MTCGPFCCYKAILPPEIKKETSKNTTTTTAKVFSKMSFLQEMVTRKRTKNTLHAFVMSQFVFWVALCNLPLCCAQWRSKWLGFYYYDPFSLLCPPPFSFLQVFFRNFTFAECIFNAVSNTNGNKFNVYGHWVFALPRRAYWLGFFFWLLCLFQEGLFWVGNQSRVNQDFHLCKNINWNQGEPKKRWTNLYSADIKWKKWECF